MTTFPITADIQLVSPSGAKLEIDQPIDPSGAPLTVLDIDLGFTFKGYVELPGWLSGKGVVRLSADEIGGPFDGTIGEDRFDITGSTSPHDPPNVKYYWKITVTEPALPDESKMYQFGVVFVFQTAAGGHTDIGGFIDLGAFLVV
jgi:hypothetical protein